jgi:transcriptional regulator with XRE-family HTH domain
MQSNLAIPLAVASRSDDEKEALKPPTWYGKVLARARAAAGYVDAKQFAEANDITYVTVWRNEKGDPARSVKGSEQIRQKLIALGQDVPPVPVGNVPEFSEVPVLASPVRTAPGAGKVPANIRKLRELAGFSVDGAADVAGVSYGLWDRWESGEELPSYTDLELIATTLGHQPGHFFEENPPATTLDETELLWARHRKWRHLTPEEQEKLRRSSAEAAREVLEMSPGFVAAKKQQAQRMVNARTPKAIRDQQNKKKR